VVLYFVLKAVLILKPLNNEVRCLRHQDVALYERQLAAGYRTIITVHQGHPSPAGEGPGLRSRNFTDEKRGSTFEKTAFTGIELALTKCLSKLNTKTGETAVSVPMNLSLPVLVLAFAGLGAAFAPATPRTAVAPVIAAATYPNPAVVREENEESIPWTVRRIVGWEDFQSTPLRGTEAVASTSTSLGLSYQVKDEQLSYEVTCNFSKTKSWGLMKTDYILAHEQGHFDITEICARRLHQALSAYTYNRRTYKQDLTRIYNNIVSQKEQMQENYDHETDHSRNKAVQAEWMGRIEQMLEESQDWATYP
jgi:hypothetical protein